MKPGDLVLFLHPERWEEPVGGRTALVLDVRRNSFGMWEDDIEFDVLVDGAVVEDLLCSRWDGRAHEGIDILAQSCATAGGS